MPQRHGPQIAQHHARAAFDATIHVERLWLGLALTAHACTTTNATFIVVAIRAIR